MSTVGYGDIGPTNPYEKIYTMILVIVGCSSFAYMISAVS